jgi:lysosomal alpha-mannosidase
MFTGILFRHYFPPPGFCFDFLCHDSDRYDYVDSNTKSATYNLELKVEELFEVAENMSHAYKTNNIMIPMGDDFHYQEAEVWYTALDKIIS